MTRMPGFRLTFKGKLQMNVPLIHLNDIINYLGRNFMFWGLNMQTDISAL